MNPDNFITTYETALASQNWKAVEPLVSNHVSVTFSNGNVHQGKHEVQKAFENNFSKIKSEKYVMENIVWLKKEQTFAVYLFEFNWSGIVDNKLVSGSGIGTSVIIQEDKVWKLLTEHLGKNKNLFMN